MVNFMGGLATLAIDAASKLLAAVLVFLFGRLIINKLLKVLLKLKLLKNVAGEVRTFAISFVKLTLYVLLTITIISILGVPMASIVAVLASAGMAIGLALQGALSNLAGGVMLMLFKPFHVGDYVEVVGVSGTVNEITLFYTTFVTPDNRRVTVPNGTLMNANVINFSTETTRRVELKFACGKGESPAQVQALLLNTAKAHSKVLADPVPFARLSGATNEAMEVTVRVWCANADYWDVYFDLTQQITEAMAAAGISAPSVRISANK